MRAASYARGGPPDGRSPAARRSRKVGEVAHNPWAEVAWYFPNTREQFRVLGKLTVVDSQTDDDVLQKVHPGYAGWQRR